MPKRVVKLAKLKHLQSKGQMSFESARQRMVDNHLQPRGISDRRLLTAMATVPRHLFVQDALQSQAYGDFSMPIGSGQTISQPYIVALMTQALNLTGEEKVLEIGTGCGYQTAILSHLCQTVYTIERIKQLHIKARKTLDTLQLYNIICSVDDGTLGWSTYQPYDAIIVTAGGPTIPKPLINQLADPGYLVIPIGERERQQLVVVHKKDGNISQQPLEEVRFVSLIGDHGWQN